MLPDPTVWTTPKPEIEWEGASTPSLSLLSLRDTRKPGKDFCNGAAFVADGEGSIAGGHADFILRVWLGGGRAKIAMAKREQPISDADEERMPFAEWLTGAAQA